MLASSGTAALTAPLIACRIAGKVLLPAFTFPATLSAVKMAGAEPYLMDVSPEDWRVMPEALDDAFARTGAKAAILLCPFGLKTRFDDHIRVARSWDAILIIDNAAGLGMERHPVEADPNVFEAFSLHATKPFGIGEGGMIFGHKTRDESLRRALNFGLPFEEGADGGDWGINGKLTEIHAAIGLAVMETIESRLARRRDFAHAYMRLLSPYPGVAFPGARDDSCWQMFPFLVHSPEIAANLVETARGGGVEIRRYYRPSLSKLPGVASDPCPVSEDLAGRMCCLPVYSLLSDAEAGDMLAIVDEALKVCL